MAHHAGVEGEFRTQLKGVGVTVERAGVTPRDG